MKGSGLNSFYIVVGERFFKKKSPKIKTPSNKRCCWSSVCTGTRNKICSKKPFRDNQGHLENPYDLEPLRSRPSLKVSDVASQCNARYDETEPLRPAPYPRSFEPTPSSHIKPGLRRQKCRCCPSRCSSPDCHSSTVGRPPGFCTENSDIQPRRLSTSDAQQDFQQVIQVS